MKASRKEYKSERKEHIFEFIKTIQENWLSILFLFILYFVFFVTPQFQDLLILLVQDVVSVVIYYILITLLASCIWYFPKYYITDKVRAGKGFRKHLKSFPEGPYEAIENEDTSFSVISAHYRVIIPRILGALSYLVIALSLLRIISKTSSMSIIVTKTILISCFVLIVLIIYEPFYNWLKSTVKWVIRSIFKDQDIVLNNINERRFYIAIISFALIIVGVLLFSLGKQNLNKVQGEAYGLNLFAYTHMIVFVFFLLFTTVRKKIPLVKSKKFIARLLFLSIGILFVIFLIHMANPMFGFSYGFPISALLVTLIVLFTTISLFNLLSSYRELPITIMVILGLFVVGSILSKSNDHYEVAYTDDMIDVDEVRPSLEQYLDDWININSQYIKETNFKSYPLIIAAAEGGGNRAGYWTGIVHDYLETVIGNNYFERHLFMMTGASGGGNGNAVYFASKHQMTDKATNDIDNTKLAEKLKNMLRPKDEDSIISIYGEMYKADYLSKSIWSLFSSDLVQEILGIHYAKNRGVITAQQWENKFKNYYGISNSKGLGRGFFDFWEKNDKTKPILIMNTTEVNSGTLAIYSPVSFANEIPNSIDIYKYLKCNRFCDIPISNVVLTNAAFPFVSPGLKIGDLGQFVDAGYFDNYGATTALHAVEELKAIQATKIAEGDTIYEKIKFVGITLSNDPTTNGLVEVPYDILNFEPTLQGQIPPSTFLALRKGHGRHSVRKFKNAVDDFIHIQLTDDKKSEEGSDEKKKYIIPVGRILSQTAIAAMDSSLVNQDSIIRHQLREIEVIK